ncbi:CPBP family intramembrane metalloprotease [Weissella viridescens]|uniref:CPBP family intramembrane glutamic endopeptidase n=1 Tax=Weissella viridescens TaxID=1629 RepID=UPI001746992F|nr:type II CAAX endopeptidase family protein [Weissella viridescens]QOD86588.1 CPBP family intramembrane metalloprotease [Weissella viridescens]
MNNKTLKTVDNLFKGIVWLVVGIILNTAIQLFATAGSQGLALSFGFPAKGRLATVLMVGITIIFMAMTVSIMLWAIRRVSPNVGLHPFQVQKLKWVGYGFASIIVGSMVINAVRVLVTGQVSEPENQRMLEQMAQQGGYGLIFILVLAVIVAPLVEELIFRGIILNYFFKNGWWWTNVFLSAGLFGLYHVYTGFNLFDFLQYSLMGLILAIVYKKTRQIQYAMALHFVNNSFSMLVLVLTMVLH